MSGRYRGRPFCCCGDSPSRRGRVHYGARSLGFGEARKAGVGFGWKRILPAEQSKLGDEMGIVCEDFANDMVRYAWILKSRIPGRTLEFSDMEGPAQNNLMNYLAAWYQTHPRYSRKPWLPSPSFFRKHGWVCSPPV